MDESVLSTTMNKIRLSRTPNRRLLRLLALARFVSRTRILDSFCSLVSEEPAGGGRQSIKARRVRLNFRVMNLVRLFTSSHLES